MSAASGIGVYPRHMQQASAAAGALKQIFAWTAYKSYSNMQWLSGCLHSPWVGNFAILHR